MTAGRKECCINVQGGRPTASTRDYQRSGLRSIRKVRALIRRRKRDSVRPMARILLIDDDDALRTVMAKAIVHGGHQVIEATDGKQGVELFHATEVDLVITDLIMPVQEGVETILQLRRARPELPIIAISGGVSNSKLYLDIAAKIGARHILAKPFGMSDMLAAINAALPAAGSEKG